MKEEMNFWDGIPEAKEEIEEIINWEEANKQTIKIDEEIKNRLWKLEPDEYEKLIQSLINEGCREPLILWNNILVDGHNRYEICKANNITYKTITKQFNSKNDVLEWIDTNQLSRRNLLGWQRDIVLGRLNKLNKQTKGGDMEAKSQNVTSQKNIAKDLGTTKMTLNRAEKYTDAYDDVVKNYGKEKADTLASKTTKKDFMSIAIIKPEEKKEIITKITEGKKTKLKDVKREIVKEKQIEAGSKIILTNENLIDIRLGDFTKVLANIPNNSIDIILTDPPYPYEYIECWTELGKFAEQKLKDGGFLIAYSGHIHLPEVINRVLNTGMKWYWLGSCLHTGNGLSQVFEVNMFAKHKPILFFYKGNKHKQSKWTNDVFESKDEETKEFHKWGQTADIFDKLIKVFEPKIVVDPFLGGGTTAIACLMNNVKFIGAELEEDSFNISKKRISDYGNK